MNKQAQEEKHQLMTTAPVEKLVLKMALPSMISMMISSIYNMVDTLYVGRLSTQAAGAVGVVFSYMSLIQAFAFFFGHGSANFISRSLGAKNTDGAAKMAATGFFSCFIAGLFFMSTGLIFMDPLLYLFGSTETILPDAQGYFFYILLGTPFIMTSFVMNNQMRLQGNAHMSMIGMSAGAILNIILDPVFIFAFDMGVAGAGLATAISQFVSFIVLIRLSGSRDGIPIRLANFRPRLNHYKQIISGGTPSLARQGITSVSNIVLNQLAGLYGDPAIAAFSITARVMMLANSALIGFGQGFQPVCGFNFGAKLYGRVRKAFWFSVKVGTAYSLVCAVVGFAFAPQIIAVFRGSDPELLEIGVAALRAQSLLFVLNGYIMITSMYLQTINKTFEASVVAMARQGIFFIPIVYLLNFIMGLKGMIASQPLADVLTFIISLIFGIKCLNSMGINDAVMQKIE
ncbi:MAG: MATE family efflux transporter [Clostridiales bacterium]|jgi:putative MATE family efflux protein|nr:MATE family efflux transporter [Clostridiales bacterium]